MGFVGFLFKRHPVATLLLAALLAMCTWLGVRFVKEAFYFRDDIHQQQDLEPWMSPRYVGKSWDLPPETIVRIMELDPDHRQRTLADVTAHLGITMEELQTRVETAKREQAAGREMPDPRHDAERGKGPGQKGGND